jgi:serine/threonine protein kinase/WD40 repeat protein
MGMIDHNASEADPLGAIADEFVEAFRQGKRPSVEEFAKRYPAHAGEIREILPALVLVEKAKIGDAGAGENHQTGNDTTAVPLQQLGDYQVLREIAQGGMGVVYEAEQISLGRRVALKILPQKLLVDLRAKQRFEREAKTAARLHHTNIVPVFGVGEHEGLPYYVMQFIQGLGLDVVLEELKLLQRGEKECGSVGPSTPGELRVSRRGVSADSVARSLLTGDVVLAAEVEGKVGAAGENHDLFQAPTEAGGKVLPATAPISDRLSDTFTLSSSSVVLPGAERQSGRKPATYYQSVARIGVQVAEALEYAHRQGILHRDIKPSNLLLDTSGTVWMTDFGLAKADDQLNLTHTGDVLGTLRYMPPEAFEGKTDVRTDVYALGLTLYEMLAFRPAFNEKERAKLIKQVMSAETTRLKKVNAQVPRDLETIVQKAIDRDPARRYQTAGDLAAELVRFLDDKPIKARRQTTVETVWRWARQHKTVASLTTLVLLLLVAMAIGSVVAAAYFRDQEMEQRGLVSIKAALVDRTQRLAEENDAAKKAAESARLRAETTLVDMQTARGLLAAERDDPARALLWFARAAEQGTGDSTRRADNHLRARNWSRDVTVPVRAFPQPSVWFMEFRPGGDLLLLLAAERLFLRDWKADRYLSWCNDLQQVSAACWSADGERLAIGYHSGVVQIRGVPDGKVLREVKHSGRVTALAFSPNGQDLAIAGSTVRILGVSSGTILPAEWKHPQMVYSLVFNRAGDRLITACTDQKVRVFAVGSIGDRPAPLFQPLHHEPQFRLPPVLIENDRRIVTVSGSAPNGRKPGELTCWDFETGAPAGPGALQTRARILSGVVASPKGDWFATAGIYGPEVWKTADNGKKSFYFSEHAGRIEHFVPGPDGKTLLSTSWDHTARLWSVLEGKPLGSPLPHMGVLTRGAFASDNVHLATLADDIVRIWRRPDGVSADIRAANWKGIPRPSFDGRLIAPGIWHEMPYSFSPIGTTELVVTRASTETPAGPAISLPGHLVDSCICADNHTLAAVSEEKGIGWLSLADVFTGMALAEPQRLPRPARSVAARPGSPQVAVACAGGELLVFDTRNGERILNLKQEGKSDDGRLSRVEYTSDGTTLVSLVSGNDRSIEVFDAATGKPRFPPIRPVLKGGPCRSFALSADSRLLATAVNGRNAAQVWDLATGRALSQPLPHPGDMYGLFCICFSPDGRRLLTGCTDGQARLWDWQAGTLACPPLKHDDQVLSVVITPDGRFALTSGRDRASKLHVWELTTGKLLAPKIPLPIHAIAALAKSATGSYVVAASSFVGLVARIDLGKLLAPPEMPIDRYRLLGELASGQRIEQGDESGLTQDQWLHELNLFNQMYPIR